MSISLFLHVRSKQNIFNGHVYPWDVVAILLFDIIDRYLAALHLPGVVYSCSSDHYRVRTQQGLLYGIFSIIGVCISSSVLLCFSQVTYLHQLKNGTRSLCPHKQPHAAQSPSCLYQAAVSQKYMYVELLKSVTTYSSNQSRSKWCTNLNM